MIKKGHLIRKAGKSAENLEYMVFQFHRNTAELEQTHSLLSMHWKAWVMAVRITVLFSPLMPTCGPARYQSLLLEPKNKNENIFQNSVNEKLDRKSVV